LKSPDSSSKSKDFCLDLFGFAYDRLARLLYLGASQAGATCCPVAEGAVLKSERVVLNIQFENFTQQLGN
jgi:hypothetical protein